MTKIFKQLKRKIQLLLPSLVSMMVKMTSMITLTNVK